MRANSAGVEGLCQVVVRSAVQGRDFLLLLIADRENNDGRRAAIHAVAKHFFTILVRQTEVEDDHIGGLSASLMAWAPFSASMTRISPARAVRRKRRIGSLVLNNKSNGDVLRHMTSVYN